MKPSKFWKWSLPLILSVLPLAGGCLKGANPPEQAAAVVNTEAAPVEIPEPIPDAAAIPIPVADNAVPAPAPESEVNDVSDAPVTAVQKASPLPNTIRPSSALAEAIKLAESGVDEPVLLSFVNNSSSLFNLRAEEIIYLNDIGVSSAVVTAMIQHDHMLAGVDNVASASDALAAAAPTFASPPPEPSYYSPPAVESAPVYADDYSTAAPAIEPTYDTFYDSLAPYGNWVEVSGYGRCWQPTVVVVNRTWQPYCDRGSWVYSDCGWYWKSDYSWGWAPFHYGRWFRHTNLGWCWTPDRVWGPSWVTWRYGGNYCGWAPLPPAACFTVGVGLTYHGRHAASNCEFGISPSSYRFVELRNFRNSHLSRHTLARQQANQVFRRTEVSTRIDGNHRTVLNHGIAPERVAAATRTPIHKVTLRDVTPGRGNGTRDRLDADGKTLSVFRPKLPEAGRTDRLISPRQNPEVAKPNNGRNPEVATRQSRNSLPSSTASKSASERPTSIFSRPSQSPLSVAGSSGAPTSQDNRSLSSRLASTAQSRTSPSLRTQAQSESTTTGVRAREDNTSKSQPHQVTGSPLILRGADRSAPSTRNQASPAPVFGSRAPVFADREANRTQSSTKSSTPTTVFSQPRVMANPSHNNSHQGLSQRGQQASPIPSQTTHVFTPSSTARTGDAIQNRQNNNARVEFNRSGGSSSSPAVAVSQRQFSNPANESRAQATRVEAPRHSEPASTPRVSSPAPAQSQPAHSSPAPARSTETRSSSNSSSDRSPARR